MTVNTEATAPGKRRACWASMPSPTKTRKADRYWSAPRPQLRTASGPPARPASRTINIYIDSSCAKIPRSHLQHPAPRVRRGMSGGLESLQRPLPVETQRNRSLPLTSSACQLNLDSMNSGLRSSLLSVRSQMEIPGTFHHRISSRQS